MKYVGSNMYEKDVRIDFTEIYSDHNVQFAS